MHTLPRLTLRGLLAALTALFLFASEAGAQKDPLVLGHRGARESAPDNSPLAFERARAEGADGVELDARVSRDGHVVVYHDPKIKLRSGEEVAISKLTLAQLKRIDLGQGQRIPTLREALDVLGPTMWVNIELKPALRRRGVERKVATIVREYKASGRVLVSSFDPRMVRKFRRFAPEVQTGVLVRRRVPWRLAARFGKADAVHPGRAMATEKAVRAMRKAGYKVVPWTVDHPSEIRKLARLKVDAIITDRPAQARRALFEQGAQKAARSRASNPARATSSRDVRRSPTRKARRARGRR